MSIEKQAQNNNGIAKAQTLEMISLAEYQEGSIVSRTLIDKKAGTVTFFAFDQKQGLSEHVAPFDALVSILDGEAEVVISGKTFHLRDGEMIILPANKPHALKATKRFKMMLIMIKA
jgi:quercetin dioxygenase-like cupin family protein